MNSVWGWYRETAMVIIFYIMQSKAKLAGFLLKANFFYCFLIVPFLLLTLARTCKFIPPPWTVVQGGGVDGPPLEFLIRCSISKRFYLQWKAFDILHKMRYILSVMALLGGLWRHQKWSPSWIYQELEINLKPREMVTFLYLRRKITQNKQFAWF